MVGPEYEPPELQTPPAFINSIDDSIIPEGMVWKDLFASPELNALLQKVRDNNHDLKAAWQSVLASRAAIRRFRSDGFPDVKAGIRGNEFTNSDALSSSGSGGSGSRYDADLAASWEFDLFGSIRRSVQAAEASAEVREALYQDLMFTLQADVASLYFQILSYQSEIELLQRSRETRHESLDLIQQRFQAGTVTELTVAQTSSLLATAEIRLFAVQRTQNSLIYALGVLLGQTPDRFEFEPTPLELDPPIIPAGIPGDLLTRRPDLRAAERDLAAAHELVGLAKASYFPTITLSGTLGLAAREWDELFSSRAALDSLRPGISIPLFEGGRLRANEQQAIAIFEQRLELYKQDVIGAVAEVEDTLQSIALLGEQEKAIARSVEASQQARRISMLQYQRGLSDFINALDAERTALNADQQFVQIKRAQFVATINLIRALGGSW
ncbi:MAG: efflux transporter outer membrane subunit [Verrucomicrobiae bacterium]|nr:efflux transporter outer membrane subunit [Verrucomicrobiae bacterium]